MGRVRLFMQFLHGLLYSSLDSLPQEDFSKDIKRRGGPRNPAKYLSIFR
jgi:hypothetical protein